MMVAGLGDLFQNAYARFGVPPAGGPMAMYGRPAAVLRSGPAMIPAGARARSLRGTGPVSVQTLYTGGVPISELGGGDRRLALPPQSPCSVYYNIGEGRGKRGEAPGGGCGCGGGSNLAGTSSVPGWAWLAAGVVAFMAVSRG